MNVFGFFELVSLRMQALACFEIGGEEMLRWAYISNCTVLIVYHKGSYIAYAAAAAGVSLHS